MGNGVSLVLVSYSHCVILFFLRSLCQIGCEYVGVRYSRGPKQSLKNLHNDQKIDGAKLSSTTTIDIFNEREMFFVLLFYHKFTISYS